MAEEKTQLKKYSKDDLLKLGQFVKDKHAAAVVRKLCIEPGIREIVFRPSNSNFSDAATVRTHHHRSSSIITNPWAECEEHSSLQDGNSSLQASNNDSPTPSMRRGKIEQLLKDHGSPPGIRVTAGGRIVPDGMTPLASPRYPLNTYRPPNNGHPGRLRPKCEFYGLSSIEGYIVDMGKGNMGQIVNGLLRPIGNIHSGQPLIFHSFPENFQELGPPVVIPSAPAAPVQINPAPELQQPPATSFEQPTLRHLYGLRDAHASLEQQLKDLNRNEVLFRNDITPEIKQGIVNSRRLLVEKIDEARKAVNEVKRAIGYESPPQEPQKPLPPRQPKAFRSHDSQTSSVAPMNAPMMAPMGQFAHPYHPHMFAGAAIPTAVPIHPFNGPTQLRERSGNAGMGSNPVLDHKQQEMNNSMAGMNLDGTFQQMSRRSHAVPIKDPSGAQSQDRKSSLNPKSPAWEPLKLVTNEATAKDRLDHGGSESPFIATPRIIAAVEKITSSPSQKASDLTSGSFRQSGSSTANTSDFFPADPERHTGTKYVPGLKVSTSPSPWIRDAGPHSASITPVRRGWSEDTTDDGGHYLGPTRSRSLDSSCRDSSISVHFAGPSTGERHNQKARDEVEEQRPHATEVRSQAWWAGFGAGAAGYIPSETSDPEYFAGYRQGMIHRKQIEEEDLPAEKHTPRAQQNVRGASDGSIRMPGPPANSLSNTPLHSHGNEIGLEIATEPKSYEEIFDKFSSATRNKYSPPHLGARDTGEKENSNSTIPRAALDDNGRHSVEAGSPLARRYTDTQKHALAKDASYGKRAYSRSKTEQRFPSKVMSSVASTTDHALAVVPAHFDGSLVEDGAPASPTKSPTKTSPMKRAASLAVQSLGQLAGSRSAKPKSSKDSSGPNSPLSPTPSNATTVTKTPTGLPSPEKARWRLMFSGGSKSATNTKKDG